MYAIFIVSQNDPSTLLTLLISYLLRNYLITINLNYGRFSYNDEITYNELTDT